MRKDEVPYPWIIEGRVGVAFGHVYLCTGWVT